MPLGFARDAFDKPDVWDEVEVVVDGDDEAEIDVGQQARSRPSSARGSRSRPRRRKGEEVQHQLQALNVVLYFFAGMALFVGGFLIFNSFNMTVLQRMREIGMQRTLGATRAMIVRSVLLEASVLGVLGAAIGLGLGSAAGRRADRADALDRLPGRRPRADARSPSSRRSRPGCSPPCSGRSTRRGAPAGSRRSGRCSAPRASATRPRPSPGRDRRGADPPGPRRCLRARRRRRDDQRRGRRAGSAARSRSSSGSRCWRRSWSRR